VRQVMPHRNNIVLEPPACKRFLAPLGAFLSQRARRPGWAKQVVGVARQESYGYQCVSQDKPCQRRLSRYKLGWQICQFVIARAASWGPADDRGRFLGFC
jgi:hypothetical protein